MTYNDLVFLKTIQLTGLTEYSFRIQTQLNIIRDKYIHVKSNNDNVFIYPEKIQYDYTNMFKIGVLCENHRDFKEEIFNKVVKTLNCKIKKNPTLEVEKLFQFFQFSNKDYPSVHSIDGYIETPKAFLNKDYLEIKSAMYPNFNTRY